MKHFSFTDPISGIWWDCEPAYNDTVARAAAGPDNQSDDEFLAWVMAKQRKAGILHDDGSTIPLPDTVVFHVFEETELEARYALNGDRAFRNAWEADAAGLPVVNMPKARGIHMDAIRTVRNAELVKEDITFMRAVEAGDTDVQATIATKKTVLRDIPQTFDLTTDTPVQLKAKWPTELPARE